MPEKRRKSIEPYFYAGQIVLAANSNGQLTFQVASNFHFFLTRFSYKSTQVAAANTIPTFDIQILKNEHAIMYDYMPAEMFAGAMTDTQPAPDIRYMVGLANWFKMDKPYPFEAKSNIIVNLRDTCGQANTVRIGLAGWKEVYFS